MLPAKEGSEYCERCHEGHVVHREFYETRTNCIRCRAAQLCAPVLYCEKHLAEYNAEVEKLMVKNEAISVRAKSPEAPAAAVEQQKESYDSKVLRQKREEAAKRKTAATTHAVAGYTAETKRCAKCVEVKETDSTKFCEFHQGKIDEVVRGLLAPR
jgi:hypothetical protein